MTASTLTSELTVEFSDVPPTLIASTVQAAAAARLHDEAVEEVARTDVAALAAALRRSTGSLAR